MANIIHPIERKVPFMIASISKGPFFLKARTQSDDTRAVKIFKEKMGPQKAIKI